MEIVRPLDSLSRTDTAVAGGKAANLGELIKGGFDVPPGFVVTTAAYDAYVAGPLATRVERIAAGVHAGSPASATNASRGITEAFHQTPLPAEVAAAVLAAYEAMGGGEVAVRSSATAEDMADASFAGQQDTYLGISSPESLLDAVRSCQASLWSARALAYRARLAADGTAVPDHLSLAVVVQRMVPADVSGVMFTLNPASGRTDEVVIDAAPWLGEALVSGEVTPAEYVVRGNSVTSTGSADAPPDTLDQATVLGLAALGRRVARHFDGPQDIEWAIAGGRIQLLQARPVTAVAESRGEIPRQWHVPRTDALYFRASIIEQLPDPLTPLFADMAPPAVVGGLTGLLRSIMPTVRADWQPEGIDFVTINGYAYYEYSIRAFWELTKLTPKVFPYLMGDERNHLVDRWRDEDLPRYRAVVGRWSEVDAADLPATTLLDGAAEVLAAGCSYYSTVQTIIPQSATAEMTFAAAYDRLVRRTGEPESATFVLGFDSEPIRAEQELYGLAAWVREQPALATALADLGFDAFGSEPEGVSEAIWEEWLGRLNRYLTEFGHTVFNLDFANPVPADDPRSTLETLRFFVGDAAGKHDPVRRQERTVAAREQATAAVLERLDPIRRKLFRTLLDRAQVAAPMREDALAEVGFGWPVLRRLLLELGRRLVASGLLTHADDVFWLSLDEASAACALLDRAEVAAVAGAEEAEADRLRDLRQGAEIRRPGAVVWDQAERTAQAARIADRLAAWRGEKLATPPGYLPRGGWLRMFDSMMPTHEGDQSGPVITGLAASSGVVEGVARVVDSAADLSTMRPGEVLVASITTPAFTPLFAMATAVVTDVGGMLSHSSIVAREYGIPAVLGTGVATKRIQTGDRVRVDGNAGTVTLLDETPEVVAPPSRPWLRYALAAAILTTVLVWWRRRH